MTLLTNIVAYWKFDDGSGTSATDATGNGYTGTLSGGTLPSWVSGKINDGLSFNGSNGVSFPAITLSGNTTVNFWANFSALGGVALGGSASSPDYFPYVDSTNIYVRSGGNDQFLAHGGITTSAWHMISITDNVGASVYPTFYLDGTALGGTPGGNVSIGSLAISMIGAYSNLTQGTSGVLDEIGIWSRALSAPEIAQLYNSGAGLQYPFSGGATQSLFRQNNLTGIGAGGPFFQDPLARVMLGWRKTLAGLLVPDRKMVPA